MVPKTLVTSVFIMRYQIKMKKLPFCCWEKVRIGSYVCDERLEVRIFIRGETEQFMPQSSENKRCTRIEWTLPRVARHISQISRLLQNLLQSELAKIL